MRKIFVLDKNDQIDDSFEPINLEDGDNPKRVIEDWICNNIDYLECRVDESHGFDINFIDETNTYFFAKVSAIENIRNYFARFKIVEV